MAALFLGAAQPCRASVSSDLVEGTQNLVTISRNSFGLWVQQVVDSIANGDETGITDLENLEGSTRKRRFGKQWAQTSPSIRPTSWPWRLSLVCTFHHVTYVSKAANMFEVIWSSLKGGLDTKGGLAMISPQMYKQHCQADSRTYQQRLAATGMNSIRGGATEIGLNSIRIFSMGIWRTLFITAPAAAWCVSAVFTSVAGRPRYPLRSLSSILEYCVHMCGQLC